ncbi:unnamed protein product [Prunus brigantina]
MSPLQSTPVSNQVSHPSSLWHQRLGHPSLARLKLLSNVLPSGTVSFENNCDICPMAKQTRLPFPLSSISSNVPFALLHCDIWGPHKIKSHSGARYFLTIVDDYTRCTWLFLMTHKSETQSLLKSFFTFVRTQFHTTIMAIRADNGTEFLSLRDFFLHNGVEFQRSCVYTPQQNGVVERKHRHILSVARALLFQANLPLIFWGECVLTAVFLMNRLPTPLLSNKSPYERLYNRPPTIAHLKVFGCLCYATVVQPLQKFDSRARRCIFVGYPTGQKGYRLYDLATKQFIVSRDVKFHEHSFPYSSAPRDDHQQNSQSVLPLLLPTPLSHDATQEVPTQPSTTFPTSLNESAINASPDDNTSVPTSSPLPIPTNPRQSTRLRQPPSWHKDYHMSNTMFTQVQLSDSTPPPVKGTKYPLSNFLSYSKLSTPHRAFLAAISGHREPTSYAQAAPDPLWQQAMKVELDALQHNKTWSLVPLPAGQKPIGCKWVYKIKYHSDGTIERYKARLVAKGYTQLEGIDYQETFSPTAKLTTVCGVF